MSGDGKPTDWPSGLHHAGLAGGAERGAGAPLPADLRQAIEAACGADLTAVRIHPNSAVAVAQRDADARAFTTGQDIFFRPGAYNPASAEGKALIAHEVAHVLQQRAGVTPPQTPATPPGVPVPYPNVARTRR